MSTEIITKGNSLIVKQLDRAFGGRQTEVFKIDGDTGIASFKGTSMDAVLAATPGTPKLTVAAQVSTSIDVTIQLKDITGANLKGKTAALLWLSDTAGGAIGSAPSGAVTIQTGTDLKEETTKLLHQVMSDVNGVVVIRIIGTSATTTYVNAAIGNKMASSAAVTFA